MDILRGGMEAKWCLGHRPKDEPKDEIVAIRLSGRGSPPFPSFVNSPFVTSLTLEDTEWPADIPCLPNITNLHVRNCTFLEPVNLARSFPALKDLFVVSVSAEPCFPLILDSLKHLTNLLISDVGITAIPILPRLKFLILLKTNVVDLPPEVEKMNLWFLSIMSPGMTCFPENVARISTLTHLFFPMCGFKTVPPCVAKLTALRQLGLIGTPVSMISMDVLRMPLLRSIRMLEAEISIRAKHTRQDMGDEIEDWAMPQALPDDATDVLADDSH